MTLFALIGRLFGRRRSTAQIVGPVARVCRELEREAIYHAEKARRVEEQAAALVERSNAEKAVADEQQALATTYRNSGLIPASA